MRSRKKKHIKSERITLNKNPKTDLANKLTPQPKAKTAAHSTNKKSKSTKNKLLSALFIFLFSILTVLLIVSVYVGIWLHGIGALKLTRNDLKPILAYTPDDNTLIFDRNGQKLGDIYSHFTIYTPYSDIP
ncbi:MAG: hypothetical protein HQK54_04270, partial [Oligoflexales bacterium]|nr:hypothetical protein [Oligoflexales bacterium]